jgi:magnesium chelatase family protein
MLAKTFSSTPHGIDAVVIQIEAARRNTTPRIQITGLPGEIVKESRERVTACLNSLGYEIPSAHVVVHLSPASSRKQGSQFDLPIALCILRAEGFLRETNLAKQAFLGELGLDGRVHRVEGALALIQALDRFPAVDRILIPHENAWEAGLVNSAKVKLVRSLGEVLESLRGNLDLPSPPETSLSWSQEEGLESIDDIIGQSLAKRALEVALAGRHHLMLIGPPGVGKSLIAQAAPDLLPPLTLEAWVEVAKIYGVTSGEAVRSRERPFRSPHHSISASALLGGGSGTVIAGEVTLAHEGILFLDELPEFRRDALEGLREPLQSGTIHLHRIGHHLTLPARFTLIAAMNPCPCGYALTAGSRCRCGNDSLLAYRKRISGPILDRIDLGVILQAPSDQDSLPQKSHDVLKKNIQRAMEKQRARYQGETGVFQNGDAQVARQGGAFGLGAEEQAWLDRLKRAKNLSYRSLHKIQRVARTIADLDAAEQIQLSHLREAWGLRCPTSWER